MKRSSIFSLPLIIVLALFFMAPSPGVAQDFVYQPINPAFGGSPLNYSWLLSSAGTQNKYSESQDFGFNDDPVAGFHENLQRQVLSELTQNIIREKLGDDFSFTQESTLNFGEFTVDVIPGGNGVSIRIFNAVTGQETSITIPEINV